MNQVSQAKDIDRLIHILLVDDDHAVLEITRKLLERKGYIVASANKGSEALAIIKEYNDVFDVIITDYDMPGMDGIELAMSSNKLLVDTPIILYTGKIDFLDIDQAASAGIAEVVDKPSRIKQLDITIQKVISEKE